MELQQQLVDSYLDWLKERITVKNIDQSLEITTPFMDRHNDFMQIYIMPDGDNLKLTDDGYIISDLQLSGCDIDSSTKRKKMLDVILSGYGVTRSPNNELYVLATPSNFPQKKHMLIQAMFAANDMFLTSRDNVASLFWEDVEQFLVESNIRFSDRVSFTGKSGFTQNFDFLISRSSSANERLIQTMNNPSRARVESLLFAWDDIKDSRRHKTDFYAFINDSDKTVSDTVLSALRQYEVQPILWSNRNKYIHLLSA